MLFFVVIRPNEETKITILILMLIGFIALDLVYIAVVINYCVQCGLLIFYIEGLQLKIREGILTIMQAMKVCMVETVELFFNQQMLLLGVISVCCQMFVFVARRCCLVLLPGNVV